MNARSALVAASASACVVGLLGFDGGLIWLVAGVWTIRAIWGAPLSLGWGIAVLGAGVRWGTIGLAGIESATRVVGPTIAAGTVVVRVGMITALVAAVVSEAASGGLRAVSLPERAAAFLALMTLVAVFCVPGPGSPQLLSSLGWWAGSGAVAVALCLVAGGLAARMPGWVMPALAAAGCVAGVGL